MRSPARLDWALALVAAFTAIAFALRVRGIGEGLYADELYTWSETHGRSFTGMLDAVANGSGPGVPLENTPPLHFTLAWLSIQLGDATSTIRLPSVILGTATVPAVFLLGRQAMDRAAGVAGAGFVALSPFATFYGIEARAYGMLMLVSVLSALALLRAVESRRAGWWVAYAVATAAVLYTHYTGVLVIAIEAAWVLWRRRERWRSLLLAYAGVAIAYLPWLPHLHSKPAEYDRLAALIGRNHWGAFLQWIGGSGETKPSELPGTVPLVLLGCGVGLAVAVTLARRVSLRPGGELVLLLAASPLLLLLYAVVGTDLFVFPRNMASVLPFAALAVGWVITRPGGPISAVAVGLVAAGLGIGAAMTLEARFHRPDFPGAAELVDEHAAPGDRLVYYGAGFDPFIIRPVLQIYLDREPSPRGSDTKPSSVRAAFDEDRGRAGRTYLVSFADELGPPSVPGWEETEQRFLDGAKPLVFASYRRLDPARYEGITARPGPARGALDSAALEDGTLTLGGWVVSADGEPVTRVLAFAGDRLVAAGVPNRPRPDVPGASSDGGRDLGFRLATDGSLTAAQRRDLRVVALAGGAAAPLQRYCPGVGEVLGC